MYNRVLFCSVLCIVYVLWMYMYMKSEKKKKKKKLRLKKGGPCPKGQVSPTTESDSAVCEWEKIRY